MLLLDHTKVVRACRRKVRSGVRDTTKKCHGAAVLVGHSSCLVRAPFGPRRHSRHLSEPRPVTFPRREICVTNAGWAETGGRALWQHRVKREKEEKGEEAPYQVRRVSSFDKQQGFLDW